MSVELLNPKLRPTQQDTGSLVINSRYVKKVRRFGLSTVEQFLELPGEVVSGHRDRHVVETKLGSVRCFLKKEHRVSWSARWNNWREGFGRVSLSEREARTLEELRAAGIPVPECIAHGSSSDGRSFLLLRHVGKSTPLATALDQGTLTHFERWQLAQQLGAAVARIHRAGFNAPDLSMKHVLVNLADRSVVFIDWARAKRVGNLDQNRCLHAIARLHASVAPQLASPRERLLVLQVFLRTLGFHCAAAPIAREVDRIASQMSRRRSVAEQTHAKAVQSQRLRWIGGEHLCITRPLWRTLRGIVPEWLRDASLKPVPWRTVDRVAVRENKNGWLIQLPRAKPWQRLRAALTGKPVPCQAVNEAGLTFRMKRMGLPVCQVMAFGGRPDGSGFILSRSPEHFRSLREWVALPRPGRNKVISRLGQLIRKSHDAGCYGINGRAFIVVEKESANIRLIPDGRWQRCRSLTARQIVQDLHRVARELRLFHRRDVMRLARGYLRTMSPSANSLKVARAILEPHRGGPR